MALDGLNVLVTRSVAGVARDEQFTTAVAAAAHIFDLMTREQRAELLTRFCLACLTYDNCCTCPPENRSLHLELLALWEREP